LWYGLSKNSNKYILNQKSKINLKQNIHFFQKKTSIKNFFYYQLYIPIEWDFIYLKNKQLIKTFLFFFSNIYYLYLPLPLKNITLSVDKNTSSMLILLAPNNYTYTFLNWFTAYIKLFTQPIFKKIKFKGKGYYIYKNFRNTITPQFGYSHRLYFYTYKNWVKFLSKTTILIFGLNKNHINYAALTIRRTRFINIFTLRGVRFSKQIIYKKLGKVSSYR